MLKFPNTIQTLHILQKFSYTKQFLRISTKEREGKDWFVKIIMVALYYIHIFNIWSTFSSNLAMNMLYETYYEQMKI